MNKITEFFNQKVSVGNATFDMWMLFVVGAVVLVALVLIIVACCIGGKNRSKRRMEQVRAQAETDVSHEISESSETVQNSAQPDSRNTNAADNQNTKNFDAESDAANNSEVELPESASVVSAKADSPKISQKGNTTQKSENQKSNSVVKEQKMNSKNSSNNSTKASSKDNVKNTKAGKSAASQSAAKKDSKTAQKSSPIAKQNSESGKKSNAAKEVKMHEVVDSAPAPNDGVDETLDKQASNSPKNYHISLREDGKWQVKLRKGEKALKLFDTQAEAIVFAKEKAKNQDGHITIHKVDGKIRKQKY